MAEVDYSTSTTKWYKIATAEITDEEYKEIRKYSKGNDVFQNHNLIATILRVIGIITYVSGFIVGIAVGDEISWDFSWGAAFACWFAFFFSGTTILGFAEIIQLLNDIKNK